MASGSRGQGSQRNQLSVFGEVAADAREQRDAELERAGLPKRPAQLVPVIQQYKNTITGLDLELTHMWDGNLVDHEPYTLHLEWKFARQRNKAHKRVIKVYLQGPLMDEPEPPEGVGGYCPNLPDYEAFVLMFANNQNHYLEVAIGPHGHWCAKLHKGIKDPFNLGEELEIEMQNTWEGNNWSSMFEIPIAYFPADVSKYNIFKVHGYPENRQCEALFPAGEGIEVDLHRTDLYGKLDRRKIIPEGFNDTVFDDLHFGDLWSKSCPTSLTFAKMNAKTFSSLVSGQATFIAPLKSDPFIVVALSVALYAVTHLLTGTRKGAQQHANIQEDTRKRTEQVWRLEIWLTTRKLRRCSDSQP